MKITLFRILITIGLLWGGGQGLYTALTNRTPSEITVADYIAQKSDAKWLRLTEGKMRLASLSYSGGRVSDQIKEVFIPLVPAEGESPQVHVLIASKKPEVLAYGTKLRDASNPADAIRLLLSPEGISPRDPVEGIVRFGIDLKDDEVKKLRELSPELAPDFVILTHDDRPDFAISFVLFAAGGVMLFFMGLGLRKRAPTTSEATPPPVPATASTTPATP